MNQDLDPSKYHVLNSKQKRNVFLLCLLIFLIIVPVVGLFYYKFAVNRPAQITKEVTVEIKKGEGVRQIATNLHDQGVLNSEALFVFYVMSNKLDKNIQAGVYKVNPGTSMLQLVDLLQHGTNDTKLTFLEGWRVQEFAREASQKLENVDYDKFVELSKDSEGKLFPDTYFVSKDINEQELFDLLRDTFDQKVSSIVSYDKLFVNNLNSDQAFILASLIERESYSEDEKPIIAGILIRRLSEGEILGIDATTQYAIAEEKFCNYANTPNCPTDEQELTLNWWPKELTQQDLDFDSPYNTRKNSGLPPAPIASFSLSSLEAVVNPQKTDYLYYFHDSEGNIYYSKTLEEHNLNVSKYLR